MGEKISVLAGSGGNRSNIVPFLTSPAGDSGVACSAVRVGRSHEMGQGSRINARAIARFLDQRFGDGLVYLLHSDDKPILSHAMRQGFVSGEGYLTPEGYSFWRRNVDAVAGPAGA
jgi:hypothetical protein